MKSHTHTETATQGVRPLPQTARILLEAVLNSENGVCSGHAELFLNDWDNPRTQAIAQGEGSFMTACLQGDAKKAWWNADGSNRKAIKEAVFTVLTEYNN